MTTPARILVWVGAGVCTLLIASVAAFGSFGGDSRLAFATPISWEGPNDASGGSGSEVSASVRLKGDGTAELLNFPQGSDSTEKLDGRAYSCLDRSDAPLYSGAATREVRGSAAFIVTFGESSVLLRSGKSGYFLPDPDWSIIEFSEYNTPGYSTWTLYQKP